MTIAASRRRRNQHDFDTWWRGKGGEKTDKTRALKTRVDQAGIFGAVSVYKGFPLSLRDLLFAIFLIK